MQRVRRLASLAVVATLAVTGMSACRSAPDVAVYFGSGAQYTVADVQRVFNDARSKLEASRNAAAARGQEAGASAAPVEPVRVPLTGPEVVSAMVGHEVVTRLARERNVSLPAEGLPLSQVAEGFGLPADTEFVRLYTESAVLLSQLLQGAPAGQASEADLQHVFDVLNGADGLQPGTTFDQFKEGLPAEAQQALGQAAGLRDQVRDRLEQLDVRVNPRYEPAEISIYAIRGPQDETLTLIGVPLSDTASPPVTDAG